MRAPSACRTGWGGRGVLAWTRGAMKHAATRASAVSARRMESPFRRQEKGALGGALFGPSMERSELDGRLVQDDTSLAIDPDQQEAVVAGIASERLTPLRPGFRDLDAAPRIEPARGIERV